MTKFNGIRRESRPQARPAISQSKDEIVKSRRELMKLFRGTRCSRLPANRADKLSVSFYLLGTIGWDDGSACVSLDTREHLLRISSLARREDSKNLRKLLGCLESIVGDSVDSQETTRVWIDGREFSSDKPVYVFSWSLASDSTGFEQQLFHLFRSIR
ncbi:MAG: hypothetical protein ABIA67_05245 [Candidatus Margulisiibacteriota bacterium]